VICRNKRGEALRCIFTCRTYGALYLLSCHILQTYRGYAPHCNQNILLCKYERGVALTRNNLHVAPTVLNIYYRVIYYKRIGALPLIITETICIYQIVGNYILSKVRSTDMFVEIRFDNRQRGVALTCIFMCRTYGA